MGLGEAKNVDAMRETGDGEGSRTLEVEATGRWMARETSLEDMVSGQRLVDVVKGSEPDEGDDEREGGCEGESCWWEEGKRDEEER